MTVFDLTQPVYDGMPVWPGDPEVKIKVVQTLEEHTWEMRYYQTATHVGTHVNVPVHMVAAGKTLDDYTPEAFFGPACVVGPDDDFPMGVGLLFQAEGELGMDLVEKIGAARPPFIGAADTYPFEVEAERELLRQGIISFENLVHLDRLPPQTEIMFYGLPLRIAEGDGSPVRAIAILQNPEGKI